MDAIHTIPPPAIERGDWTNDRRDWNITEEEFDAIVLRIQAEQPERFLSRKELDEKIMRLQEERTVGRRAEMVGA